MELKPGDIALIDNPTLLGTKNLGWVRDMDHLHGKLATIRHKKEADRYFIKESTNTGGFCPNQPGWVLHKDWLVKVPDTPTIKLLELLCGFAEDK